MRCLIIALIVAMGVAAGIGWRKAHVAQVMSQQFVEENEGLRRQLASLAEEQRQTRERDSKEATANAQELAKLRAEVSRLRVATNETEKLRAEVGALKTQTRESRAQPAANATPTAPDQFPRQSWAFSGYATPDAAVVSTVWAMKEGKPQVFLDSLSPEEQQRMAQSWQGKSEEEIAAKHQKDVGNIQGVRILSRTPISPTEVQMQVFLEGANRVETFKMNQAADQQWKFGGFVRNPRE